MDTLTPAQRKKTMQHVKSKNTKPELFLRKKLWKKGLRYRIHGKKIIGKPDIYLQKLKIAIFVDSDFWHGRLYLQGKSIPQSNKEYWIKKFKRNIKRDKQVTKELQIRGWTVLRFWESDIYKNIDDCVSVIMNTINYKKQFSKPSTL